MEGANSYTVVDAIESLGFGPFQWRVIGITCTIWMFDGMEVMLTSILGPVLMCRWSLSPNQLMIFSTGVFCGISIGSPILGKLSDKYGRRKVILVCLAFMFCYGAISSMAPNFPFMVAVRTTYGLFLAVFYQLIIFVLEFVPAKDRVKSTMTLVVSWTVGSIIVLLLALGIMPKYGWRWWVLANCFPAVMPFLFVRWYPESVMYLSARGDSEAVEKTLKTIAECNGTTLAEGKLSLISTQHRGKYGDLIKGKYFFYTALTGVITQVWNKYIVLWTLFFTTNDPERTGNNR